MRRITIYLLALALSLLWPQTALAQDTPADPVEGQHGAAYVSYGYAAGGNLSLNNLQFDVDLRVPRHGAVVYRPFHRPERRARRATSVVPGRTV